jgi:hypothetical protein
MAITYINTGTIANDGTGDDLREAFIKINNNFEDLDLRIVEEFNVENLGSLGEGIYGGKVDGIHGFKRLVGGSNISLSSTSNGITINGADSLDQLVVISDSGTLTVARGQTMTVRGGEGTNTRVDGQTIYIDLDDTGIVAQDTAPQLTATLNADNNDIVGVRTLQANTIQGQGGIAANIEGLVYGYDIREFGDYLTGFDFGNLRETYNNTIEFIMQNVDMDFATVDPDVGNTVDLGYIV